MGAPQEQEGGGGRHQLNAPAAGLLPGGGRHQLGVPAAGFLPGSERTDGALSGLQSVVVLPVSGQGLLLGLAEA